MFNTVILLIYTKNTNSEKSVVILIHLFYGILKTGGVDFVIKKIGKGVEQK